MDSNSYGKIHIRKRPISQWLLCFVFFFPFFQSFISEFLRVPDVVKFLCDVFFAFLLIKLIAHRSVQVYRPLLPFAAVVTIFFVYTLIAYLLNYQSIFYYIWGLRNNFRFYIAFFAFAVLLDWEDAKKWLEFLDWVYIVNFFIVLIQFFGGFGQDYLGGIFGVQKGCNGSLVFFLTVVVSRTMLLFMSNGGSKGKRIFIAVTSLMISALAELKIFFLIFIFILFISALMTEHSIRKTIFFAFCGFFVFIFSTILSLLYEEFTEFLSLKNLWNALVNPNYATENDIGRFTAIPVIFERFLTNFPQRLFGMGLGNCDSSSLSVFNTQFYDANYSIHYSYFLYAFMFLETGAVGLSLYILFFILALAVAVRFYKQNKADKNVCQLAIIVSIMCFAMVFYNTSLRTEIGFLVYFVLALPVISARHQQSI